VANFHRPITRFAIAHRPETVGCVAVPTATTNRRSCDPRHLGVVKALCFIDTTPVCGVELFVERLFTPPIIHGLSVIDGHWRYRPPLVGHVHAPVLVAVVLGVAFLGPELCALCQSSVPCQMWQRRCGESLAGQAIS